MIHCRVASGACSEVRIVGRATLTMVVSSRAMAAPSMSTATASQRRRDERVTAGCGAVAVGWEGGTLLGMAGPRDTGAPRGR